MTFSHVSTGTKRMLILFFVLAAAWLLWSGVFKPLLFGLGALSCLLTCYLARRMGNFDNEIFVLQFSLRLLGYWAWLVREVARSSIEVARVVLDPQLPISPRIIKINATAPHPVDQVIFGNSIGLTPGTLAIDVHHGVLTVHTLTDKGAVALMSGEMNRRVATLRGD